MLVWFFDTLFCRLSELAKSSAQILDKKNKNSNYKVYNMLVTKNQSSNCKLKKC